jgi:sugar phosphate isomerase/epimerase
VPNEGVPMPTTSAQTSVQLYSVRDAVAEDLDGALARLAEIGLEHVEPYAFHERTEEYGRAFAAAGVTAPSGHAPVLASDSPEAILDAAAVLGMAIVIDPFVPAEHWQTAEQVAELAERVNRLSVLAAERGLEFGYHNHNWELSTRIDGRHALEVFVGHLAPEVVLEVDTYWTGVGGADTPALLAALGDRVRLIHVKDGTLDGDVTKQQPAGSGEAGVPAILAAAPQATRVIEFDAYAGDVFEGIAQSFAWLKENDR